MGTALDSESIRKFVALTAAGTVLLAKLLEAYAAEPGSVRAATRL